MTGKTSTTKSVKVEMPVTYNLDNPESFGFKLKNNGRIIEFDDNANDGFDDNSELKIESTDPELLLGSLTIVKNLLSKVLMVVAYQSDLNGMIDQHLVEYLKQLKWVEHCLNRVVNSGQTTKTIKIGSSTNVVTLTQENLSKGSYKRFGRPRDVRETEVQGPVTLFLQTTLNLQMIIMICRSGAK